MVTLRLLKLLFIGFVIFVLYHVLSNIMHISNVTKYSGRIICYNNVWSLYNGIRSSVKSCRSVMKSNSSDQTVNYIYNYIFHQNITYADDMLQWQLFIHKEGKYKVLLRSSVFADSRKSLRDTPCIRVLIIATKKVPNTIWKQLM